MDKLLIKRIIKKLPFAKRIHNEIKTISQTYDIPEITPLNIKPSNIQGSLRLNLLIPSVNKEHAFGGINTALNLFEELRMIMDCRSRIICVDATIGKDNILPTEYRVVDAEQDNSADYQAVSFADRYGKKIIVERNDIFIATAWWTAYNIKNIIREQSKIFSYTPKPFVYIIQDFEPGFYPWSTRYLLADSTYGNDVDVFALINSEQLKTYLEQNDYKFKMTWDFPPVFNAKLKEIILNDNKLVKKVKRILIYGRPSVPRNAFELIIEGLKLWSDKYKEYSEWEILSAGEIHSDIALRDGVLIKSVGKLSLEEYADLLKSTYAGISLMVSPHPSYPPLEMSVFGIKTITNTCYNKDLSTFNDNIISLTKCTPNSIADALESICNNFEEDAELLVNSEFVQKDNSEIGMLRELAQEINKII